MDLWNESTGVLLGALIATGTQIGTQIWGNWRADKQQGRQAIEQAKAERDALQVRTLADLQEQLEAVSVMIGGESARPVKATMFRNLFTADDHDVPDLTPYSRSFMLCSRLNDQELAALVRDWLRDVRSAFSQSPLDSGALLALRDRRVELQNRLGEKLLGFYE